MITKKELAIIGVFLLWLFIWTFLFLNIFVNYLNTHLDFPIPLAWIIHQTGYFISFMAIGWILTGTVEYSLRLGIGTVMIWAGLELTIPPLCLNTNGQLLVTPTNASCLMGNDSVIAYLFSQLGISFGSPLLFYATYIGGFLIFMGLGALLLKEKEMWRAIFR